MLKRFLSDSLVYGIAAILTRGIAVVLVPIFTRLLAPEEYGALDLLTVFATLANYVVAAEITQGIARYYHEARSEADKTQLASTAFWFCVLAYGSFTLIAVVFAAPLTEALLGSPRWTGVLQVALGAIAANGLFYVFQNLLRWQMQPRRYVIASLIYSVVSTAATLYLLLVAGSGVAGVFWGQIVGAFCGVASSWWYSRKSYRWLFSREKLRKMLSFSVPLVPSSIAVYLAVYIDRIAIKELATLDDVGIYGVGARIASVVALLMMGFQGALTPLVMQSHENPATPMELARIFRYFLALALPAVLLLGIFSRELVWLFATPEYYAAWSVVPVLGLSTLLASMYIFAPGLGIRNKTWFFAAINMLAAGVNLVLNLLLIPLIGIMGAALATLITAFAAFASFMVFSQRLYPVPHEWTRIAAGCTISGIILVASLQLSTAAAVDAKTALLKTAVFLLATVATAVLLLRRSEIAAALSGLRRLAGGNSSRG